jgi:hypothetical protein
MAQTIFQDRLHVHLGSPLKRKGPICIHHKASLRVEMSGAEGLEPPDYHQGGKSWKKTIIGLWLSTYA